MALQSLILPIISIFRSQGLNSARQALTAITKDFKGFAKQVGMAAGSFAAFSALTTARQFTIEAVDATQRFERSLLALNQVFETAAPTIRQFTKDVSAYGLSQQQAAQASVFLGSVLKQYGFTTAEASGQTQNLVKLAQDLATTYGYDVQEALLAITALFRGEYDPIEKFGVAMKQNEINAELAARGLGNLTGAAEMQAAAQIRLELLFERAGDSMGAFERATNTLYGSQQLLLATLGNLQVAAGAPLQEPLAKLNNLFTDLLTDLGPEIQEVFDALGGAIDTVAPTVEKLARGGLNLVGMLEQVIGLIDLVLQPVLSGLNIALDIINPALELMATILDGLSAMFENIGRHIRLFANDLKNSPLGPFIDGLGWILDNGLGVGAALKFLNDQIAEQNLLLDLANGNYVDQENGARAASAALRGSAAETRNANKEAKALQEQQELLATAFRKLAGDTRDVEGNLTGLAKIFADVDEAAAKSEAKEALTEMGIEASAIEEILTQPNWQEIFENIAKYARLAAIDITKVSYAAAVGISNQMMAIEEFMAGAFGDGGGGAVTDFVGDFFDSIEDGIAKESARRRLQKMGASEGLIEAILGAGGWEEVFQRVIRDGVSGLQALQAEFNKTAEGIEEIAEATREAEKAQQELLDSIQKVVDKQLSDAKAAAREAQQVYDNLKKAADSFRRWSLDNVATIQVLPDVEEQLGRFESSVVSTISGMQSQLQSAVRSGLIEDSDFNTLRTWVATETTALADLARSRDQLAERYSLSESLISEYQQALTGSLRLTSLFSKLKDETETITVSETTQGIMKLGASLREFEVTVARSYEKTIENVQDKSAGLVQGFRDMADKARGFAENLRKLRDMGLDPMLFNELVSAGVEAGGETAQALVDGGSNTILEINDLFAEINKLGAELGMDVGQTMYEAGQDLTFGLLEGLQSEQQALYDEMVALAKGLSQTFRNNLDLAIQVPLDAAQTALDEANAAVETATQVNTEALLELEKIITGGLKALDRPLSEAFEAGITEKVVAAAELYKDVLSGAVTDISGVGTQMSSKDLRAAALATGGTNVQNFYLNVAPGNRLQQSQTVEEIRKFVDNNGSLSGWVSI